MIRIASEEELLQSFRPIDQEDVQLPMDWTYPLAVTDYVTWTEPSGHRVFLVFNDPRDGRAVGLVFKRTTPAPDVPASMCQFCHSVRGGSAVGLLSASAGRNRRVGLFLCRDLGCKHRLKEPGANDLRETLPSEDKVRRLLERMSDFARGNMY